MLKSSTNLKERNVGFSPTYNLPLCVGYHKKPKQFEISVKNNFGFCIVDVANLDQKTKKKCQNGQEKSTLDTEI